MADEELKFTIGLDSNTAATRDTKKTFGQLMAFPGQFAQMFLIKVALISWGFNPIRQAGMTVSIGE